ncbi:MAG: Ig-like domain repeat protein, partial [Methanobrevibacter sp.]|nr:Ig-like domain repeat protein [Methanobrevibacter sp.]
MAILAIAILLLCLGSVSAVDEYKLNFTLETVNDNSQNENIVIDEIIENADDADEGDASVVSISKEKNGENLLKATNDDTLKSSEQGELRDKDTGSTDVVVPAGTSVTVQASMEYDYYWYLQMSRDGSSYSTVVTDTGHVAWYDMYTFTVESGTYYFKAVNYNGRYGSPSNILTYTVGAAVEETQTSISIDPTTVAPNNLITITPTVTKKGTTDAVTEGVVKFFYGGGTEIGEIDLSSQTSFEYTSGFADEGTYDIYAVYQANDKYGESTSDAVSVLVSQDTSKTPVTVTVALSKTGVAPGETITITPSVKNNNGEDVTGVVDLYYGNDNLIASGVAIGSSYSHAVSETSGEYQVYAKYLGNDDLAYAPGTSAKYVYKVKKQVQITLKASANEVTPSSYGSTRVTFEISCSETLPALKLYLNDEEFSTVSAGSTSASISFDSSDAGSNTVYVYLAEDEDFVEATSNTETVKVYTTVSVTPSITLNQSSVVEGKKLLGTVTASSNAPGTITIYSDSSYQNEIATLPVGESYEYTVPVTEGSSSYYTGYLYVYYNGYDDGYTRYTHYAYASGSKSCTVLRQNNAVLTGNGKTDDVEIDFGGSVILHIDLEYWKQSSQYDSSYNTVYVSNVVIYLDGEEFGSFEVNRESSGYYDYTYSIADYEITFGDAGDEGTHTIYAYYEGSNEYGAYYAPATINILTVNVKPATVATATTLTAINATPKYGDKITVTPKVNDGEVTTGTITYYIGDNAISEALSLNTPFEYTVDGVTPVTITGKFSGDGYEASEGSVEINPVKAENNIVVTADEVVLPDGVVTV